MTRIERTYRPGVAIFSPDGKRFVTVVWRGDLDQNANRYSLLLFDVSRYQGSPVELLSVPFKGDPSDQHAGPISEVRFMQDNKTVAFIGTFDGPAAVYTLDVETRQVSPLVRHRTAIRSFDVSRDGTVVTYSALAEPDARLREEMRRDGFSLFDSRIRSPLSIDYGYGEATRPTARFYWSSYEQTAFARMAGGDWLVPIREYFLSDASGTRVLLKPGTEHMAATIHEGHMLPLADVTVSPSGTHATLIPFTRVRKDVWSRYRYFRERRNPFVQSMATTIGLVDLRSGSVESILDTPIDFYATARPVWSPDGQSIIVRSVLPLTSADATESDPHLLEVDLRTREIQPIPGSAGWEPVRWNAKPEALVLRRGASVGTSARAGRHWRHVETLASASEAGFNPRYAIGTNGEVIVGVTDGLLQPPELAMYDLPTRKSRLLTDLNPDLRHRRFGPVEKAFWNGPAGDTAFGYLVKPVGFTEGLRYPVVILLKDESSSDTTDNSFIIDGQEQLSGWAIQTFAARGILTLLTPAPPSHSEVAMTDQEGPRMVKHVENAIRYLNQRNLIDERRVGLSGWSRAAYWTDYVLTHSTFDFAAATDIDGGGNYKEFQQRWGASDVERDREGRFLLDVRDVRTPLLSEQHGEGSLFGQGEFIMALRAHGKPVDVYYYPDAPHSVKTPRHRLSSLQRHVDWFQFWLQDYEDSNPAKQEQYERWRLLRTLRRSALTGAAKR